MPVKVVIGMQWGDEGKGKIVDVLSQNADIVARYDGGDNAGHTVENKFGKFNMRLLPSGILNPNVICIIGPGVVVNIATLVNEIDCIERAGIEVLKRLWISPRCHVVMPYHQAIEAIYEEEKGKAFIDTTKRGIGQVYADKVSYNGIRLFDFEREAILAEKLRVQLKIKNHLLKAYSYELLDANNLLQDALEKYERIRKSIREPFGFLQKALKNNAIIVLEGAQSTILDINWGTYPFCSASDTLSGGITAGIGIAPKWITEVIGVAKSYTTRVGNGPMPTELFDEQGESLRKKGKEYGTSTGRVRRCGWFDMELARFSSQLSGITEIALTKIDVLDSLPTIKICVGYHNNKSEVEETQAEMESYHYWEGDSYWLWQCESIYEEIDGWLQSTTDLPGLFR